MALQKQQNLLYFIEDVRSNMTAEEINHYDFLQEKLNQFREFRKISAGKERIDSIIKVYQSEIQNLEIGVIEKCQNMSLMKK